MTRLATPTDRPVLAALLANTWRRYGPLAADEQVALLANGLSALTFDHYDATGFLGLALRTPTGDPPERWADVEMLAVAREEAASKTVRRLLDTALTARPLKEATGLACLAAERWVRDALSDAGFVETDRVINYTRSGGRRLPATATAQPATLRPIRPDDTDTVLALNAGAFVPFWRYDPVTTLSWLLTADHAVMAEVAGQAVGFALTTKASSGECAQLIRVAVRGASQGYGIGRQLVVDAILFAQNSDVPGLSLNTQTSNRVSRRLYESLGFRLTGSPVAVMILRT